MKKKWKAALIGLDTCHAVDFARLLQDPGVSPAEHVDGMEVTCCLRFDTPFQSRKGLGRRQEYLESLGIPVTEEFETAVAGCDALLLTIDDPAAHAEYFMKCAALGKPMYLDKPFADTSANARRMLACARSEKVRFFTASALRYDTGITAAAARCPNPEGVIVYGALGDAPAGSSIIWYAVHCFEILTLFMGCGASAVTAVPDGRGILCHIRYPDGRRGVVELRRGSWQYGGVVHTGEGEHFFFENAPGYTFYTPLLRECVRFFNGESEGVRPEESLEILLLLEALERSVQSGRAEAVRREDAI